MNTTLKKVIPVAIIAALAIAAWASIGSDDLHLNIDGDEIDGPLGVMLGMLFGGAGLLIAAIAMTCAAVFVGLLFASLGVLMVVGLALLAVVLIAAISPLLLPLLIPAGIFWFFTARARKQRQQALLEHAV
ncbi:MAG: hypothetical protein ACEQSK_11030 [Sphingomonadaceae bacterium]